MTDQDNVVEIEPADDDEEEASPAYDLSNINSLIELFKAETADGTKPYISAHIKSLIDSHGLSDYEVIFLYDESNSIQDFHSNKIYNAVSEINNNKDILLILLSQGGKIEPAYLISKTCKRLCKDRFVIAIPRRAKSAATLISLGADELHMGLLSELGPIDPQIGGFPALGLANALERIATLAEQHPGASEVFSKYLINKLELKDLGYFERINESAGQYAERLLAGKVFPDGKSSKELASHFVNHYKDHSFVIDTDEASSLLGDGFIKEGTAEYKFSNDIYQFIDFLTFLYPLFFKKNMRYVGNVGDGIDLSDKEESFNRVARGL
ncbi:MAG: hypothetical protein RPU32_02305 [Candidatus Sedimenticola sp. (ex Thyasira tokunagai)]